MQSTKAISLGLEDDDNNDNEEENDPASTSAAVAAGAGHPRRFLRLPSGHVLAYGGDNGNVSCLVNNDDSTISEASFVIVHRYDDPVRALAVSSDGKRLAVGFDNGETKIHVFDDYNTNEHDNLHPYIQHAVKTQQSKNDDVDDDDDPLLSQDFDLGEDNYFIGPDMGTPVRDLLFLPMDDQDDSYRLAVASEAGMVVVDATNFEKMSNTSRLLEEDAKDHHDHCGIRGFAMDENNAVMASLAMDGRLCLWDIKAMKLLIREESVCVHKKDVGEIHGADPYDRSCRPFIHQCCMGQKKSADVIGTPGKLTPFLRVLDTNTKAFKDVDDSCFQGTEENGHIESIVAMLFCSDDLLVTSGRDSRICVWSCQDDTVDDNDDMYAIKMAKRHWKAVEKCELASPATDLFLHHNQILAINAKGLCQILDVSKYLKAKDASSKSTTKTSVKAPKRILKKGNDNENHDDEDDDVDFGTEEDTSQGKDSKKVHFLDDEADEDNDEEGSKTNNDEEGSKTKEAEDQFPSSTNDADEEDNDSIMMNDDERYGARPPIFPASRMIQTVKAQPAFSPSSTPLDLTRRFLCWNHIGSVTLMQADDDRNTIDINFTDSAFKRPISFTDNINFIIGSIGEDGGIFASDLQEDDDDDDGDDMEGLDELNMSERTKQAVRRDRKKRLKGSDALKPTGSSIFFYRFETFGPPRNKDWYLTLPDGERALGASCGEGWSAVMTSRRFLRFFTSGGNQCQVVWLKGEPVTMAGRGRFLAVFYHEASPMANGTQQLGYTLWDASAFRVISQGSVSCLSKGASLSWVGFSNDYFLLAMDSDGMLSMLVSAGECNDSNRSPMWEWAPVLDTVGLRKSKDDSHWPVTVYDGKLVCVPLKGGNTYPDAARRPVTTVLGLRMPLAKSVIPKNSAMEELSVRSNIVLSQKKVVSEMDGDNGTLESEYVALCAQVDKVTLKLFAATVDAGKLEAALDLIDRLHLETSYNLAIQLADRHHKLADMIEEAKLRRFADNDDDGYDDEEDGGPSSTFMDRIEEGTEGGKRNISPDSTIVQKKRFRVY